MNKFSIGFSILSTLAIGAGCADEASIVDADPMGEASFALQNGIYAITATIDINTFPEGVTVVDNRATGNGNVTFDVALTPDTYAAAMVTWDFFRSGDLLGTNTAPGDVAFTGFLPESFTIAPGVTTDVDMTFVIGTDQTVTFTSPDGDADFTLVTTDGECEPTCGVGLVCAEIDDDGPFCATTCATAGPTQPECVGDGFTGTCLDGDGTNANICEPAPA